MFITALIIGEFQLINFILKSATFQRNVDEVMKNLKGTQESIEEGMTKIVVMMMDDGDEGHEDVEVNYYDDNI